MHFSVDTAILTHKQCRSKSFQPNAAGLHVQTGARGGRLGTSIEGEKEISGRNQVMAYIGNSFGKKRFALYRTKNLKQLREQKESRNVRGSSGHGVCCDRHFRGPETEPKPYV